MTVACAGFGPSMSARAYLYRRNGTYYFRWSIPRACRLRLPAGSPLEVRISLATANPAVARHRAARYWLASLDVCHAFLVAPQGFRYNALVDAIRGRVRMTEQTDPATPPAGPVSLGAIAGTVEVQALKDAMAALDRLHATFYVAIGRRAVGLWEMVEEADGSALDALVERVEDFADPQARLTRDAVTEALCAQDNRLVIKAVQSDLPGMWRGSRQAKRYLDIHFDQPVTVNLSSIMVDASFATTAPPPPSKAPTVTTATAGPVCDPILLSKGLANWIKDNADWSEATKDNYSSYVQQFIEIVGDVQTTDLTADHFRDYDDIVRRLPKNWRSIHTKTGKSLRKIADETTVKKEQLSPKTLKEKGATLKQFFSYLEGQGYWHGRYGMKVFHGVKERKADKLQKKVFSNAELKDVFTGTGLPVFQKAKFALYVWGSVLLLYTGARPAEISQLRKGDVIKDVDGTWYLRISASDDDEEGGKQLKTDASSRSVPLHSAVIDLGFTDFVASFATDDPLFPEAMRHEQKISREIGDWFNQKLLPATPYKAPGVSLYCLRHTVIERFKADATLDYHACAYTGHGTAEDNQRANKVFAEKYGRAHQPKTLADSLHPLLDFGIDWTPMKAIIQSKSKDWATQRKLLAKAKKAAKPSAQSAKKATP